jgi:hypothetical protein
MQINAFLLDSPVSNSSDAPDTRQTDAAAARRRHPLVIALAAVIFAESAVITAVTVYLVVEILIAPADSVVSAIALAIATGIAAVWVFVIAINVLRGNAWVRGAAIVVQVLIGAVAIGSLQGEAAQPVLGVVLLVPAIAVLVLLFAPPVVAATSHREP